MAYEFVGGPNVGSNASETIFGSTFILAEPAGAPQDILDNYGQTIIQASESVPTAIQGRGGNDTLIGDLYDPLRFDTEGDTILGGAGNDLIFGDTGTVSFLYTFKGQVYDIGKDPSFNARLQGGDDRLFGGTGNDRIYGGGNGDVLRGENGNDTLDGGTGADVVNGGADGDRLTGGQGRDVFEYARATDSRSGSGRDTILDFQRGSDRIDLVDIDAVSGAGNQSFSWIGSQAFHRVKGELHYRDLGAKVLVEGDTNGDGRADFQIDVRTGSLSAGDFYL